MLEKKKERKKRKKKKVSHLSLHPLLLENDGASFSSSLIFLTFHRVGVTGEGQAGGPPPPSPSSSPCCGPRDGIQLPDNLAQACDPLTPQPSCYQLPLTHTQSDAIILLQRVYWHRGFKAWACGPIPFSLSALRA